MTTPAGRRRARALARPAWLPASPVAAAGLAAAFVVLVAARVSATHVVDVVDRLLALAVLLLLVASQARMWGTQRRLTAELTRSESFFRTLVRCSVDPVVLLDDDLTVTFASPSIADLVGVDASAVVGRHVAAAVHPDDVGLLAGALSGDRRGGGSTVRTARLRHADGSWRLLQATVRDLREDPDVDAIVLFCRDVTPRSAVPGIDPELLELALTDPVTGLPNRTALVRRLAAVQRGAAGQAGAPRSGAVALLGLDGPADDETALRAVTSRLTRVLRGEDWLARGGHGDFVVVVEGSIADAEVAAARLVAALGTPAIPDGPVRLTAVAGVTSLAADVDPGEALRRCAVALDSARRAGPGSVHRYDDALRDQQDRRAVLRADLAGATARGELRLVFQPVVDLVLQRTVSVEALLRWRHPVFGDVAPSEFVPLAEESALICDLGRWVLHEACAGVAALPGEELSVAVNVSSRHVRSGELVADVLAALEAGGLPASRLVVEITESVLVDDPHVVENLAVLRSLGVRVAVDDFGTGWSSLAYLVGLPVDVLKMDQHFLADLETDPQRQALCRAVLQLGGSLGLPVVVEGVTTGAQLDLLRDMGHRFVQGFAFSRPLEAAELLDGVRRTGCPPAIPAPRTSPGARVAAR